MPSHAQLLRGDRGAHASSSSRSTAARRAGTSLGGTSSPVTPSSTASRRPPDRGSDDRASVGHRLPGYDAIALPPGRADDDSRALVVRAEIAWRDEADGIRNSIAERPVSDDHTWDSLGRLEELEDALLFREPPDEEDVGWFVRHADLSRQFDAARNHTNVSRSELAPSLGERAGRAEDDASPSE